MAGGNDFGHRAHAHGVGPDEAQKLVLGGGFQHRAGHGDVHAAPHFFGHSQLFGGAFGAGQQGGVVGGEHVGEARAQLIQVLADERVVGLQVDVVLNQHQVRELIVGMEAAGGVADEELPDTQQLQHPHGHHHLLHTVAFVVVKAALQHGHPLPTEPAQQQAPGVAFDGGSREMRDVGVADFVLHLYFAGQRPQAGAQDDARFGLKLSDLGLNVGDGFE